MAAPIVAVITWVLAVGKRTTGPGPMTSPGWSLVRVARSVRSPSGLPHASDPVTVADTLPPWATVVALRCSSIVAGVVRSTETVIGRLAVTPVSAWVAVTVQVPGVVKVSWLPDTVTSPVSAAKVNPAESSPAGVPSLAVTDRVMAVPTNGAGTSEATR